MDERLLMSKQVLVLGDSFTWHHDGKKYHWLNQLAIHNDWKIDNLSIAGSGPFYVVDAFLHYINNLKDYDIILFAWSEPTRFYHRRAPWLNGHECVHRAQFKPGLENLYETAQMWYQYALDFRLEEVKSTGLQYWFDNYLSENFSDKQIYHMYCFPKMGGKVEYAKYLESCADINNQQVYHLFKTGVSVLPTLVYYSVNDPDKPKSMGNDTRAGHLSESAHCDIFNKLNTLVNEPYSSGRIFKIDE
jgi:hypothetical protein